MKNKLTSLGGVLLGTAYALTNTPDWKHLLVAALMAFVGLVAKDFNVSGV